MYRQLPENVENLNNWFIENDVMEKMQANLLKQMRVCITIDGDISNIYCKKRRCSKIINLPCSGQPNISFRGIFSFSSQIIKKNKFNFKINIKFNFKIE